MNNQDTITVTVTEEDFRTSKYQDPKDCSVAKALKRMFPDKNINVGGTHCYISTDKYKFMNNIVDDECVILTNTGLDNPIKQFDLIMVRR